MARKRGSGGKNCSGCGGKILSGQAAKHRGCLRQKRERKSPDNSDSRHEGQRSVTIYPWRCGICGHQNTLGDVNCAKVTIYQTRSSRAGGRIKKEISKCTGRAPWSS